MKMSFDGFNNDFPITRENLAPGLYEEKGYADAVYIVDQALDMFRVMPEVGYIYPLTEDQLEGREFRRIKGNLTISA